MRYYPMGFAIFTALGFAFCACTADPGTTGSGGAAGSGGAGGWDCHDVFLFSDPCDACLADKCCADLSACSASVDCIYCVSVDKNAETCRKQPQRSLATAIHECGWGQCKEECIGYGRPLGPDPNDPIDMFCSTVGPVFCEALFTCCATQSTLNSFGGTLDGCKAMMSEPTCLQRFNIDDSTYLEDTGDRMSYGLRRRLKDGQVTLDQPQLDACVAGLTSMTAGGAACVAGVSDFFGAKCLTAFRGQAALGDACIWHTTVLPGLEYAFIPCKEGRCEEGKCVPLLKIGDRCSPFQGLDSPGACDYLHDEACSVYLGMNTWACGPWKEIGEACASSDECKSRNCDANQTCAPATSMSACF